MQKKDLTHFIDVLQSDERLNTWHISLCLALYRLWQRGGKKARFTVTRRTLMRLAHIRSFMTYHKLIRELQELDYINYQPSFHPAMGSVVWFR